MSPSRREFLQGCLLSSSVLALGCEKSLFKREIPGSFRGASFQIGHLLREGKFPPPSHREEVAVIIVGGGVAGLTAARRLKQRGISDIRLFELETHTGGNSSSGENSISAYPWGAHYLPVPNQESVFVREACQDFGLISGEDAEGRPLFREEHLCHEPEERLAIHGRFQNGLVPILGATAEDKQQYESFFAHIEMLRHGKGADGKPLFAIPLDLSSRDPENIKLDSISFSSYLDSKGWTSHPLRWYTNYCCRDDYGTKESETSAWAGLHYFAGRRAWGGNVKGEQILTWPEGNGWLVKKIREDVESVCKTGSLVFQIRNEASGVLASVLDTQSGKAYEVFAKALIYSAPRFTLTRLLSEKSSQRSLYEEHIHYAPWVVGNVTLKDYAGVQNFAWDNVSFHSASLGFVVATHQRLDRQTGDTVLTWYCPLSEGSPKEERTKAIEKPLRDWQELIFSDLTRMHRDIGPHIQNIDVCLWGHAMIRPEPGFVWGRAREAMQQPEGKIFFAHSDMSGISIFEEAQYHGILAANSVLELLKT